MMFRLAVTHGTTAVSCKNFVDCGIIQGGMSARLNNDQLEAIRAHVPLRRMGTAEDVSAAVLFLCSSMSDYITGQVIRVNGGLYM